MTKLALLSGGFFIIIGALLVLWWVSPAGHYVQRELGLQAAEAKPRDLVLVVVGLAAAGFIITGGFAIQQFVFALSGLLAGGRRPSAEGSAWPMLLWGLFGYLAVAGLFGTFVLVVVDGTTAFDKFADPQFLRIVLIWPYHLMAAIGVFGLTADSFY